jgi:hypothetical protein
MSKSDIRTTFWRFLPIDAEGDKSTVDDAECRRRVAELTEFAWRIVLVNPASIERTRDA